MALISQELTQKLWKRYWMWNFADMVLEDDELAQWDNEDFAPFLV
jgi:hypothetical protein